MLRLPGPVSGWATFRKTLEMRRRARSAARYERELFYRALDVTPASAQADQRPAA